MSDYYAGIDGGGSTLRIVVVDADLREVALQTSDTANPNIIGYDAAQAHIRKVLKAALAGIDPNKIRAVGVGIAGASKHHAAAWLRETVQPVLPEALVVPSSDNEIALVGALGKREGLLILAGTGSVGYGINAAGEQLQVGGWGYLIGDDGSGYWFGMQALRRFTQDYDRDPQTLSRLGKLVQDAIAVQSFGDTIGWLYKSGDYPVKKVASLAGLVLQAADAGDAGAQGIISEGVDYMAGLVGVMRSRLKMPEDVEIGFAGGLLENANSYSEALAVKLGLEGIPKAHYSPVIGAALLAKILAVA